MKLAESRGISVRKLLATHDSMELSELQAYYQIFPMPQEREDLRAGTIAAINWNTWKASTEPARSAMDFCWTLETAKAEEERAALDPAEQVLKVKQAMAMMRGPG